MVSSRIPAIALGTAALLLTATPLASAGPSAAPARPSCQESTLGAYNERACWTEDEEDSITLTIKIQGKPVDRCVLTEEEPLCRVEGVSRGYEYETRITANFETRTASSDHEVCAPPQSGLRDLCDEKDRNYLF